MKSGLPVIILTREFLKVVVRSPIIGLMRKRLSMVPVAALGVALVLVVPVAATTIVPAADPGELALDSEAVFLARAGASRVVSRPSFLATETELVVMSTISGPLGVGDQFGRGRGVSGSRRGFTGCRRRGLRRSRGFLGPDPAR